MHKCNKWITIMAEFCDNLTEKKEELKHVKSDLYVGNTLKAGMDEKDEFIQMQINELINMEENCNDFKEKLENKLIEMKSMAKGLPSKRSNKRREAKKDARKAKNRKAQRLRERITTILKMLDNNSENPKIEEIIDADSFFKKLHKRFDAPALKEMLDTNIFVAAAARKVEAFLHSVFINSKADSDTTSSESADDCTNESDSD
jgi:predicted RNase H-like nuclease (RuvC/YqgF family)